MGGEAPLTRRKKKQQKPETEQTRPAVDFIMVDVDNPMYSPDHQESSSNPRRTQAPFNMNESYAGFLYSRKAIPESDWKAALRITRAYESMGGAGAKAIDYEYEHVDGGQIARTITDKHLFASETLKEAHNALGPEGYDLTLKFAAMGLRPREVAQKEARQVYYRERFKECLDTLAVLWGLKTRNIRAKSA